MKFERKVYPVHNEATSGICWNEKVGWLPTWQKKARRLQSNEELADNCMRVLAPRTLFCERIFLPTNTFAS